MSFSYDTFLKPITISDNYIEILDTDLNVIYTIKSKKHIITYDI